MTNFANIRSWLARLILAVLLFAGAWAAQADEEVEDFLNSESGVAADAEKQLAEVPPAESDTQRFCVYLIRRAHAHMRLGQYDPAITDLKQALSLSSAEGPAPQADGQPRCLRWRVQLSLYNALYGAGDWLALVDHARAVGEEYRGRNGWHVFSSRLWLIDSAVFLSRYNDAESAYKRAGEILAILPERKTWPLYGANATSQYQSYGGWLQELRGNYSEAERLRRESLKGAQDYLVTIRAHRPPEHPEIKFAQTQLTNRKRLLAGILTTQGKTGEAEILAREALRETLQQGSPQTLAAARALSMLGKIKLQQGQVDKALRLEEQALSAMEASGMRNYSTFLAGQRAQIGFLLGVNNRWSEALGIFEQRDKDLRSNAAQFARIGSRNMTWAYVLLKNQRAAEAETMLQSLVDYNLKKPFVEPLYLAQLRGFYALALVAVGKDESALREFRASVPVLLSQSETDNGAENGGFARQYRLRLIAEGYLDLLSRWPGQPQAKSDFDPADEAFQIADAARGSSVQTAIANSAARANLPNAQLADLARQEQDLGNRISALNKQLIHLAEDGELKDRDAIIAATRNELREAETRHVRLRQALAERFPEYADLVTPKPPSLAEVQKSLRAGEAAVAIYLGEQKAYVWTIGPSATSAGRPGDALPNADNPANLSRPDSQSADKALHANAAFRTVALKRSEVDQLVAKMRQGFDLASGNVPTFDTAAARRLYAALLEPDAGLWADAKILNVIPHGSLGQLPFATLITSDAGATGLAEQAWLIKRVAIAQLPSISTLLALRRHAGDDGQRKSFVGFGDPLFMAQSGKAAPGNRRSVRKLAIKPTGDDGQELTALAQIASGKGKPATDEGSADGLLRAFAQLPPLPDTAEELNDIGQTLGANPQSDLYLGARATERNVKSADLSQVRVLAFATHGLVAGDLRGLDQPSLALANPALTNDTDNDGFLTLSEVLGLKLNADWVILSACNTASGDGKNQEAVSGLGRAFFFAGSRRLLASYWPVETVSARLLTTEVFRRMAQNAETPKAELLRQSILSLMTNHQDYVHPAFWAPFGLIGEAGR